MKNERKGFNKWFLAVSVAGGLFVLTEAILQSFGRSICDATGCQTVARYARFGDISILLAGLLLFSLLSILVILRMKFPKPVLDRTINFILVVSLACEGFFTGFQAFRIHMPCYVCLTVFGLLVVLGLLRLIQGEKEIITGFAAMVGVFSLCYLVLPVENTISMEGRATLPIIGKSAPDFDLTLFDGQKVSLRDLRGKSVVINFWTSG